MMTQVQQLLASGFLLLFALLALRVWRRAGPVRHDRATLAWGMTAAYFIVSGGYSAGHAVLAAAAISAGKGTWLMNWVGGWAVAANLARGVLSLVFAALLLALLAVPRRSVFRLAHAAPVVLAASAVVATVLMLRINVTTMHGMSTGLAVFSMLTAVVMMGALLVAVLNDSIDQLLWFALGLYTLKETMSVSLFAVLAWWNIAADTEAWHTFYWGAAAIAAAMCAVAARRLQLAGKGRHVPALFERLHALRHTPIT
jgi:hypothetical protein